MKQAGFAAGIATTLEELRLPPQVLELEMTESALIEDAAQADQIMAALKAIGLTLALDDFGTGFSSLSYLKKLPVDTIKIDKSFIDNLPYSDREGALVEAILSIAQRLDHRIVAEGVETPEQLHWLLAQGCRYLQGYYFSRPVPRADFLALAATVYPLRATAARA